MIDNFLNPKPTNAMPATEEKKPFYLSKTLIVNAIIAIGSLIPSVREWVSANPESTLLAVGGIGAVLRFITRGRIVFND